MSRGELAQNVGGLIRDRRRGIGLSQPELAQALGKSTSSISAYERGERQPGLDELLLLSEFLRCQVSDFFPGQARPVQLEEALTAKVLRLERQQKLMRQEIDEALGVLRRDGLLPEVPA